MKNTKRNCLKKISILLILILAIVLGTIPEKQINAASKEVGKPKVSVSFNDNTITLTIEKTDNAEGFRIYVKEPDASKYAKLKTLAQDGKAKRTYSFKATKSGEYLFKVRGYNNSTGETIWGEYSAVAKISVEVASSQEKVEIKYGSIKMKVLKSWNTPLESDRYLYLYPDYGMFMMYAARTGSGYLNQNTADSLSEELAQTDLFSSYKITASQKNVYNEKSIDTYYNYTYKAKIQSEKYKGKLTLFEYDGYVYVITYVCPESSKESKRLFNEYSKIIKSIKPQTKSDSKNNNDSKSEKSGIDYPTEESFEAALNSGKDVIGKTVSFVTDELNPNSAFGYNYWAGEHLNFCSITKPNFKDNTTVTVRVVEVRNVLGSWIIYYEEI